MNEIDYLCDILLSATEDLENNPAMDFLEQLYTKLLNESISCVVVDRVVSEIEVEISDDACTSEQIEQLSTTYATVLSRGIKECSRRNLPPTIFCNGLSLKL